MEMESTFQWNSATKVEFLRKLPTQARISESLGFKPEKYLIIHDRKLHKTESFARWIRDFTHIYPVDAGEKLKDLDRLSYHVGKIFKLVSPFSARSLCVLAVGGGTVGDFAGFLSSVVKRGVPLVHIPTTLLAAMDSAHGGKTALNVGHVKNQIGSYYPATSVLLVKSLFENLPPVQLQSAGGELAKIALLKGKELFDRYSQEFKPELEVIWDLLPSVIEAKYQIVEKDPFERTGERQILNLGHTLGHALESYYGLPHGLAVGQGLMFAIEWSSHQGYLKRAECDGLLQLLQSRGGFLSAREFAKRNRSMSRNKLHKFISEDKKLTDARHLSFVFLEGIGAPFRKVMPVESFLAETQRQGWTAV